MFQNPVCSKLLGEPANRNIFGATNNTFNSNMMVIGLQELISEVQVFAEKTGLGTDTAETFIGDMFGPVAKSYSQR
jgi:hypothetical protein